MNWNSFFSPDVHIPDDEVWNKLQQLSSSASKGPVISPTVFGERHKPEPKVTLTDITSSDLNLGSIFRSLCSGLIGNLCQMMSPSFLQQQGIKTLIASGSVMSKNLIVKQEVERHYGSLVIEFGDSCDSALGAALYCVQENVHL